MKALTIHASSRHEASRSISSALSALRSLITVPRCIATIIVAIIGLYVSLAIDNDTALSACAVIALAATYALDKKGGNA